MQTYWLEPNEKGTSVSNNSINNDVIVDETEIDLQRELSPVKDNTFDMSNKAMRLISWNREVLLRLLKQIVERRHIKGTKKNRLKTDFEANMSAEARSGKMVIDEVKEIITLPGLDPSSNSVKSNSRNVELGQSVVEQLGMYVSEIAALYRDNPCKLMCVISDVLMKI
jgi:hypothetical protein